MPFGAHLSRNALTVLALYFPFGEEDGMLKYSMLLSCESVPALFVPLVLGHAIDMGFFRSSSSSSSSSGMMMSMMMMIMNIN